MTSNNLTTAPELQIRSLRTLIRIGNLSLDFCPYLQRHDTLVHYDLDTSEAYLEAVMAKLTSLGACIDDLDHYGGAIRLTFRVPEENVCGFEIWLSYAKGRRELREGLRRDGTSSAVGGTLPRVRWRRIAE